MRICWNYRCGFGHTWTLFRDEEAAIPPEETRCPEGHEAIQVQKEWPVDEVQIDFALPLAWLTRSSIRS